MLGKEKEGMTKGLDKTFEGDEHGNDLDGGNNIMITSTLNQLVHLNMCSLLYFNYISIKL